LHQTRGGDGKRHQQRSPAHTPPWKWPGLLRIAVMVVMTMMMVMPAVAVVVAAVVVNVMNRRLAQWVAPG
jgi:hypothetical protein